MYPPTHSIHSLFDQLGLDSSQQGINEFVSKHSPLAADIKLHQANFWNTSQGAFLQQMINEDADWAEIVDELDAMLR
ncbi:MAG: DUF2789 domain-containing protein [Lentilitoribacter sp.]